MRTFLNTILVNALVLMLLFVTGCDRRKSGGKIEEGNGVINIADFPRKNSVMQEDLYDTVSYIRLDTPHLIGKFDQVLFNDSMMVVFDKQSQKVFIHRKNGDYIGVIDSRGRGEGEYSWITNISLLADGRIKILDQNLSAIFTFSSRGKFIKRKRFDEHVDIISCEGSYEYLFYNGRDKEGKYHLDILKEGILHNSYFEHKTYWVKCYPNFYSNNNHTFFVQSYDDNIYMFDQGKLKVEYTLDLGNKRLILDKFLNVETVGELDKLVAQNENVYIISKLAITDDYIYLGFSDRCKNPAIIHSFFYNKKRKTGITFTSLTTDGENGLPTITPEYSDGTHFYSLIDPSHLDEQQRQYFSKLFNCSITVESNCFLCQLTMKEEFGFE